MSSSGARINLPKPEQSQGVKAEESKLADKVIVTSDNPRTEEPEAIIDEIVAGIPAGADVTREPDRRAAILAGLRAVGEGDVLLIAGKGHETYQEFAHRVVPFDDREQVRSLARDVR